jgi:outer membrane protein
MKLRAIRGSGWAILILAVLAAPAFAQFKSQLPTLKPQPLDVVKILIERGEYDQAQKVLDAIFRIASNNPEALFLQAQLYDAQKDYKDAIAIYRRMLADDPNLPRVRLELGRALYLDHQYTEAIYQFRLTQAGDLPDQVVRNTNIFINNAQRERAWTATVGVSMVFSTNINQAPSTGTVNLLGLPFNLSAQARSQPGIGIAPFAAGEYDFTLTDNIKWRNTASAYTVQYGGRDFNTSLFSAAVGPQIFFGQNLDASLLMTGFKELYSNDPFEYTYGPRFETNWTISPLWRIENEMEYSWRLWHAPYQYLNGWTYDDTATTYYALSATSFVKAITGVGVEKSYDNEWSDWFYHVGFGYHREVPLGITLELLPEFYRYSYANPQVLFGYRRVDDIARVTLTVTKRDWRVEGFTPTISYIYTQDWSNVPIYAFSQHQIQIGISRQF